MSVLFFYGINKAAESSSKANFAKRSATRGKAGAFFCTRVITELASGREEIEFFSAPEQLTARFRRTKIAPSVLVLVISSADTLESLISIKDLFDDLFIVIILIGSGLESQQRARALGPHFIARADDNPDDVVRVLSDFLGHSKKKSRDERMD